MVRNQRLVNVLFQISALLLALLFTTLIMLSADAQPLEAYKYIFLGSFGSIKKFSDVLISWVPLLLASAGLIITFSTGLWNIGVEGQIVLGAIASTWVLRLLENAAISPGIIIILSIFAGMIGGGLWAALVGALKTFGGVNEIFGGSRFEFRCNNANAVVNFWTMETTWDWLDERDSTIP